MHKFVYLLENWKEHRFDTLVLIVYNFFIVILIASKDMEWSFHPFRDNFIADEIGLQFNEPNILPKFGFVFRFLTIFCNLFGILPVCIPKRKHREYLIPVLIWNLYTVTALLINLFHTMVSIITLQVPSKAVLSVGVAGGFVTTLYFKLILQLINFYEDLQLIN